MSDEVFAFPDSNVFLHYKPLSQIDWCGLLKARSVTLVICLPVIQELDAKKSDTRLADRARRAIKEIEEHDTGSKPLRSAVSLEIYNEELRRDEFPASLSPDSQDDRIVHLVKKYATSRPDREVCVLSEDLGMKTRCRAVGVRCHRPQESDRLENSGDEKDKKIKQLQNELATFKNRLPSLSVSIFAPGQEPDGDKPSRWTVSDDWSPLNVEAEVDKQRRAHPKHADRPTSPLGRFTVAAFESLISPQRWEEYDRKLDDYYLNYEMYVGSLNTWGANNARTIRFNVLVENGGNSPATDIDIFLQFPTKLAWLAELGSSGGRLLQKPSPPEPPEKPSPDFIPASRMLGPFGTASGLGFPGLRDIPPIPRPDEPRVDVIRRPETGHLIHVELGRMKHGDGFVLGPFFAVFRSWDDVGPFEVEYSLSASESPERETGKIPIIVNKPDRASQTRTGGGPQGLPPPA